MDWHIFGHDWAVNLLQNHVAKGSLKHAYLFVGPQGIGRRTLALRFAQALNCTQPPQKGAFCDTCRDCRQIWSQMHPDLSLLVPGEGHKDILIDQVRALQHTLSLAPYASAYRVALIQDFARSTLQAANAMLKTLEEPPDRVVLLLTADGMTRLLPTIVSRCEVIRLRPASIQTAQGFLEKEAGFSAEKARLMAHLSNGRVGAAIKLAHDQDALDRRQEHLESLLGLLSAPRYERFRLAERLMASRDKARQNALEGIAIWHSFWRDVFVSSTGAGLPLVNVDYEGPIKQTASLMETRRARMLVIEHEKAMEHLDAYVNTRLLIETLLLKWPYLPAVNGL